MKTTSILVLLALPLLIAALIGCGDDACKSTGQVGSCCGGDKDCNDLTCFTGFPNGYCSRDCSSDHTCPTGSHCIQVSSSTGLSGSYCMAECQNTASNCRSGYECWHVSAMDVWVCSP